MMIIYIAGLQSLPTDVLEAAQVDGATPPSDHVQGYYPADDAQYYSLHIPYSDRRVQAF